MSEFKSGFVAMLGRTNVGKSTLVNLLVGEKIAATANKVQTTRTAIRGIVNRENSQIIFIDTPGIHKPKTKLNETMIETLNQKWISERHKRLGTLKIYFNGRLLQIADNQMDVIPYLRNIPKFKVKNFEEVVLSAERGRQRDAGMGWRDQKMVNGFLDHFIFI